MSDAGSRKRKYNRFQVGAFMALQKKKRGQKVKETEKIRNQDLELKAMKLEIAEKTTVLRAREAKLRRLETMVL